MVKSMTGYGRAQENVGKRDITVEIKSVNNRYFDCFVKIPRLYLFAEDALKVRIQSRVLRGKIDVYVTIDDSEADNVTISVNKPLLEGYLNAVEILEKEFNIDDKLSLTNILRLPDVLRAEKEKADTDTLTADICMVADKAIENFCAMRLREGQRLFEDISKRIDVIEEIVVKVEERWPKISEEYREKLWQRMSDVLQGTEIDEGRILLEAAVFADKVSVNEEIVRLKSHISQLKDMLYSEEAVGRKLDFLIQEINREINTIGSKGNDLTMSGYVVDLKAEVEKIREQIQNIE